MSWIDSPWMIFGGLFAGFLFGFLLQKGGVGKYRVIVGQFLWVDHTVLRIMLTAIVTGAVGVYGMLALGWIDGLLVKPATLVGNLVGGLVFGVGMVGLGYCPGTGVAALGEGSRHAGWGLLGMLVGAALYTATYPLVATSLLAVVDLGKVTLSDVTGLSPWLFIGGLAAISLAAFTALPASPASDT